MRFVKDSFDSGRFPVHIYSMKNTPFFAPSITLANGAAILTGENSVDILFADETDFNFSYRNTGGEFDECDANSLNYEKLIAILSVDDASENDVAEIMAESLAAVQ